jgi:uncharacterized membrane protein
MIYSLLHGDVLAAIRFNALAVVALGFLVVAFAAWTYGRIVDRRMVSWQHHKWAAPVTLAVVVVWFVLRILPFAPFTALRV